MTPAARSVVGVDRIGTSKRIVGVMIARSMLVEEMDVLTMDFPHSSCSFLMHVGDVEKADPSNILCLGMLAQ